MEEIMIVRTLIYLHKYLHAIIIYSFTTLAKYRLVVTYLNRILSFLSQVSRLNSLSS